MPGFFREVASPAFEMCMNRTSALPLYLLRQKMQSQGLRIVRESTRDVPAYLRIPVEDVPPPRFPT